VAFRFSKRPHKQFLWLLLRRDGNLGKGLDTGLDAGCADMRNKRFFKTLTYTGLDPDKRLLDIGAKNNPEAKTINCGIMDAPIDLKADFVQCIQVFVNSDFDNSTAIEVTRKLVSFVKPGGVLLMNTGKQTIKFDQQIEKILKNNFDEVKVIRYGNFGFKKTSIIIAMILASAMYFFPHFRTAREYSKTYYKCTGKKA